MHFINELRVVKASRSLSKIPDWFSFLVELGACIASKNSTNKLITGISVPTRAFGAICLSLGFISSPEFLGKLDEIAENKFQEICSLPKGTLLEFIHHDRIKLAVFEGKDKYIYEGRPTIRIKEFQGSKGSHLLTPRRCLCVTVVADQEVYLSGRQIGRELEKPNSEFIDCSISDLKKANFTELSHLGALVIGQASLLKQELFNTQIDCQKSNGRYTEGSLQDLIRVRRFLGNQIGFKTDIIPSSTSPSESILESFNQDTLIVFDGASSYLRWNYSCKKFNEVVLLDRTEKSYPEALEYLNLRYVQNRLGDAVKFEINHPGYGVEVCAFEEVRN